MALTGHIATYAQKLAAVRAAERVEGVKAVANEIKGELAGMGRDDADIATAIARILDWDVQIRRERCTPGWRTAWSSWRVSRIRLPAARGRTDGPPGPWGPG
ncbi:MAG TPA: BON domain-containing protein [Streptosporangiaceae bacterium]|nr:BON domain-containing protein [Streptosporangiaceae bacterium]